jgi:sugar O-acyltransferase (sialic acid O-acetyltransferase NeuD family)
MHNVVIIGAGGFGRELYEMLWKGLPQDQYRFKGFLAKDPDELSGYEVNEPILDYPEQYQPDPSDRFLLAIGDMEVRRRVVDDVAAKGGQFLNWIHPTAVIASTASIGQGAVIYPYAVIMNRSVVEDFVHLSIYASVGHDARVGKYSLMAPYATLNGFSVIHDEVYLSTHSTVAPEKIVGRRSKVSANSAVMQDVPPNSLVHGVPGKQTRLITTD